ncbi:hypothetical protein [Methanoculleus receptaculi]|uniref:Uncharacterized protein n=1 Tax=Methanoculleus receptaculi TaxID=394967 RepID=A0AAX4FWC1_9EURY|nr:hypothetical protein [Methanoculleus receptaculi]WOX57499.1 hypothetical protein R6Y96_09415 [Methanoculleus receptaculi]
MTPALAQIGAIMVSTSIILVGILIAVQMFAVTVPFAPYIMVTLSILIVIGAAMLIHSSRSLETSSS